MVKTNTRFKIWILVLVFVVSGVSYISADASELSNPEQQKLQEKFARICLELESYIKNPTKILLQPIDEWSELIKLVKKQREAKNLTADEKSRMDELKKKEREAMGKFVSVGTGPNSPAWKQLEQTTDKINKLTLVVIDTIIEAYALAKGVTPEAIKKEVWVPKKYYSLYDKQGKFVKSIGLKDKLTKEQKAEITTWENQGMKFKIKEKFIFNKAGFEKLAKETNGDKNFARLLQTGGIVDELFKRYEMFFRMTDWKACDERKLTEKIAQYGITRDSMLDMELSSTSRKKPFESFKRNWNAINFKHLTPEESKQLVMNYRMSNLLDIYELFTDLLLERQDFPEDMIVVNNFESLIDTRAIFSDNKYNYKP